MASVLGVSASSPSHVVRARRRCPGIPVRIAEGADGQDLLGAALSLATIQIAGQLTEETSLDSRLMGTLGFTGALIGADVAIRDLLGTGWWIPLIPLGLAAVVSLSSVLGPRLSRADLGPGPGTFYASYSDQPFALARRQLLADLVMAIAQNARRAAAKRRAARSSILLLAIGLAGSTITLSLSSTSSTGAFMSTGPRSDKARPPIPPAPVPIELPGPSGIPHMSPTGEIRPSRYEELFIRVFGPRRSKRQSSG